MLPEFIVWLCVLLFGIVLKRYDGDSLLRTFYKKRIFLNQSLDFKDSNPGSSQIFSVEDPLIDPVMTSVALYWNDTNLAWNNLLNALSYVICP